MPKIVTTEQMRQIEAAADANGLSYAELMDRAGRAVAYRTAQLLADISQPRVVVIAGKGNNGGDGLVAASYLVQAESNTFDVRVYLAAKRPADDLLVQRLVGHGLFIANAEDDTDTRVLRHMVASSDLVIDALFGIGVRLPLRGTAAKLLRAVHHAVKEARHQDRPPALVLTKPDQQTPHAAPRILAIDCPSGLDCDSGAVDDTTLQADETITFIAAKHGQLRFPGAAAVGDLSVATLGVQQELPELQSVDDVLVSVEYIQALLPQRPVDGNKGTFGKVLIIAGSARYVGAAALAARAAYRSGAGLVTVAAPQPVVDALKAHLAEPTWLPLPHHNGDLVAEAAPVISEELTTYQAVLLGPGIGQATTTFDFVFDLLASFCNQEQPVPPVVLDADALNILASTPEWWQRIPPDSTLTPHPGEMARLSRQDVMSIQQDRLGNATFHASQWAATLVLKGAHTVVTAPEHATHILPFKTDALATAGTGDVLSGAITGLRAQGLDAFNSAVIGAFVHGLAGDLAARSISTHSVVAGDVVAQLGQAFALVEAY